MSLDIWIGCMIGASVLALGCLVALAMASVAGDADTPVEQEPLVTIVDGGVVIGRAKVLSRKGKYLTVVYEGGQVSVVDTDHVEVIEGSEE